MGGVRETGVARKGSQVLRELEVGKKCKMLRKYLLLKTLTQQCNLTGTLCVLRGLRSAFCRQCSDLYISRSDQGKCGNIKYEQSLCYLIKMGTRH